MDFIRKDIAKKLTGAFKPATTPPAATPRLEQLENRVLLSATVVDVIDFEEDAFGNALHAGAVISNQFQGVHVSATHPAMIFDSANPTGGDFDLSSNVHGNILILSEDGDSSDPDDNARGGVFTFEFDEATYVDRIGLFDIDLSEQVIISAFDASGAMTNFFNVFGQGDGTSQTQVLDFADVSILVIELTGSGAITDLVLFEDDSTAYDPCGCDGFSGLAASGVANSQGLGDFELDITYGTSGDDKIRGDRNDNTIVGKAGNDDIAGRAGNDDIDGGRGHDLLRGQAGDDILFGGLGNDILRGGRGNDILDGGAGSDWLKAGTGVDSLTGGTDADFFILGRNVGKENRDDVTPFDGINNYTVIEDFELGVDKLVIQRGLTSRATMEAPLQLDMTGDGVLDTVLRFQSAAGMNYVVVSGVSFSDLFGDIVFSRNKDSNARSFRNGTGIFA